MTIADASGEIDLAFFVDEEGAVSSFRGLAEVMGKHGLFGSLHTDRGSDYWLTTETRTIDRKNLTHVHRGLRQLASELIPAYSREARGHSERMFGT